MKLNSFNTFCLIKIVIAIFMLKDNVAKLATQRPLVVDVDAIEIFYDQKMDTDNFTFITRDEWKARESLEILKLKHPIPYVVIHHSFEPSACYNKEQCSAAMRQIQNHHMDNHQWEDIGYNFAVGSDGFVYEGQGWIMQGTHASYFNSVSIGICLIGDWSNTTPPIEQIKAAQALIAAGIQQGYLAKDCKVIGHRQTKDTHCPGDGLFEQIKKWDNYSSFPATTKDILDVAEVPDFVKVNLTNKLNSIS